MKKQKFMRLSAFTSAPALENSFSSPVGFQGEISVVFRGKAVSIHGWDGNSWTTIYIWNGIDPQFKFENTYQNYYLKSLTGTQESMGVSFFSVGKIVNSTPQFAGINRSTKLYDIEEVPVYTASDAGKLLTIMSNGSLKWLLTSETYMSDGSPISSFVSSDLEEQGTLAGNAAIIDGVLVSYAVNDYTSMPMTADYKSSSNQTISFWFKSSYTPAGGTWMRFVHSHVIGGGPNGFFLEMRSPTQFYFKGASHGLLADGDPTATSPQPLNDGQWHHVALSWSVTSGNEIRMWVDGQAITINNHNHVGAGSDSKPTLFIGAKQFNSPMEIDKMDITEEFIDGTEALYRFNAGRGTMSQPVNPYIDFSAVSGLVNNNGATINGTSVTLTKSSSQYLNLGDNVDWDRSSGEDFAVSVDFKFSSFVAGQTYDIVSKGEEGIWKGWGIMVYSGGLRQFAHSGGQSINSNLGFNAAFTPVVGQWYTVRCIWKNSGTQEMWLDGVKVAERTVAVGYLPPVDSSYHLRVGYGFDDSATRHFDGEIKNVLIEKGTIA